MDPFVPGTYVDVSQIQGDQTIKVMLKLKIPLAHFLIFHNIKFLQNGWANLLLRSLHLIEIL